MNLANNEIKTVAIDIGNSRMKLYNGNALIALSYKIDLEMQLLDYLCNFNPDKIIYSSVNQAAEKVLADVLYRTKMKADRAEDLLNNYTKIDFSSVNGMGTDRKLGLIAAEKTKANAPIITIDFGTCITINVVDENYRCLGGLILPGLFTQVKALASFTSALPQITLKYSNDLLGNNTESAINTGILSITLKGINAHILDICKNVFPKHKPNIFITGGISELASNFNFAFPYKLDYSLVMKGLLGL